MNIFLYIYIYISKHIIYQVTIYESRKERRPHHHPSGADHRFPISPMRFRTSLSSLVHIECLSWNSLDFTNEEWKKNYIYQWEFQDPKMQVLYKMFGHILGVYPLTGPYIGLIYGRVVTSNLG